MQLKISLSSLSSTPQSQRPLSASSVFPLMAPSMGERPVVTARVALFATRERRGVALSPFFSTSKSMTSAAAGFGGGSADPAGEETVLQNCLWMAVPSESFRGRRRRGRKGRLSREGRGGGRLIWVLYHFQTGLSFSNEHKHILYCDRCTHPYIILNLSFFRGTRHVSPSVSSPPAGAGGRPSVSNVSGRTDQMS